MKKNNVLIIIALCAIVGGSMGSISNALGAYYVYVAQKLNVTLASVSIYGSIIAIASSFSAIFTTRLLNKKNIKLMMFIFSLACGICVASLSIANSLISFYILAALIGFFMSLMDNTNINIIITSNIKENVGSISSFIYLFSGLFGTICSSFFNYLIINQSLSFTFIFNGILVILLSVPTLFVNFEYLPTEKKEEKKEPINKTNICIFFVLCTLSYLVIKIPSYFTTVSIEKGYDVTIGTTLLSMSMLGNIIAKFFTGKMSDKLGIVKAILIIKIISTIDYVLTIFVCRKSLLIICALITGVDFSITAFMLTILAKELFNESYHRVYAVGVLTANIGFSILLSLIVSTYDKYHTSTYIILSGALCSALAILLTLVLNKRKNI